MASKTVTVKFVGDKAQLDKTISGVESKTAGLSQKMSSVGKGLTAGLTLPLLGAAGAAIKMAGDAEVSQAKLASTFESMEAATWTSVEALNAHAEAVMNASTFDDDEITEFQAVLLTFGNVTGDVFTKATELGADMSAALGTDLQSSAIQIGKALNDPIKGVTALTRVGVSFTEAQKQQIKTLTESGDVLGAQTIILSELENQFGGTAQAIADTAQGEMKQAMNDLGNAAESIGAILTPMLASVARFISDLAKRFQGLSPEAQKVILVIAGVAAAIGPLLIVGAQLVTAFGIISKAFIAMKVLMMANPWVLLIAAVVALVALIIANWDKIVAFLKKTWDWIKQTASAVGAALKQAFDSAVKFVVNLFLNWTLPGLLIKHWDKIRDGVRAVKDFIINAWNAVVDFFRGLPSRIGAAVAGMWDGIKNAFRSAINWVIDKWNNFGFKAGFNLPDIFGGGRVEVGFDTPNIPRIHSGGVFQAPGGRREGLAILESGETVIPKNQSAGVQINFHGPIYGMDDFERKLQEVIVRARRRGVAI